VLVLAHAFEALVVRMRYYYLHYVSGYRVFIMQPSQIKFIKIKFRCCQSHQNSFSKLHNSPLIQKIKILGPLSQANASNLRNHFTSIFSLSEGRAGEAWEPSNKTMLGSPSPQ
jgi:hypothetical protein